MDENKKTCVCGADCEGADNCPACGEACPNVKKEEGADTEEAVEKDGDSEEVV